MPAFDLISFPVLLNNPVTIAKMPVIAAVDRRSIFRLPYRSIIAAPWVSDVMIKSCPLKELRVAYR